MYIYHKNDDYRAFSSLRAVADNTGINYDTLLYNFSRKKAERMSITDGSRIIKTEVITSKRSV